MTLKVNDWGSKLSSSLCRDLGEQTCPAAHCMCQTDYTNRIHSHVWPAVHFFFRTRCTTETSCPWYNFTIIFFNEQSIFWTQFRWKHALLAIYDRLFHQDPQFYTCNTLLRLFVAVDIGKWTNMFASPSIVFPTDFRSEVRWCQYDPSTMRYGERWAREGQEQCWASNTLFWDAWLRIWLRQKLPQKEVTSAFLIVDRDNMP